MNYEASIENPIDVTITNNTDVNQTIRYFMVNFQTTLKPGDSVTFTVTNSAELAFYTKMKESVEGNNVASKDIILNFPDPLRIGDRIDDEILSHEYMLELITKAQTEAIKVKLNQSGVVLDAMLEPDGDNTCELNVIDGDGSMLRYVVESHLSDTYGLVEGHNGMQEWNIVTPK